MAGLFNGHMLEFPQIRVDSFTPFPLSSSWLLPSFPSSSSSSSSSSLNPQTPDLRPAPPAQLFLLTHVHSDHLIGLSNEFTGRIICSPDTKRMLLRLEPEITRGHMQKGLKERRTLRFGGLRKRVEGAGSKDERIVDRIEAIPYGYPTEFELGYEDGKPVKVTITLLDANHCPGSTMFLVTSPDKAVLHTGDIRADAQFTRELKRHPAVQQYLAPAPGTVARTLDRKGKGRAGQRVLDRIYLDTSAVMGTGDMPDREPVLADMVEQMSLYPPDTIFFLNVWCFGWESVVQAVARHFNEPVYVDRYKRSIYTAVESDPSLLACTTSDPTASRFHACERSARCHVCRQWDRETRTVRPVYNTDKLIVSVNMVEIKEAAWALQHDTFVEQLGKAALGEGPWPRTIRVPFARHSPLPELQNLVEVFRPLAVSPNTLTPQCEGIDYFALPEFLRDCLADEEAYEEMKKERDWYMQNKFGEDHLKALKQRSAGVTTQPLAGNAELAKLVGGAAEGMVKQGEVVNMEKSSSRTLISLDQLARVGMTMSCVFGGEGVKGRETMDEYDTDEESPRYKRRRRDGARYEDRQQSKAEYQPVVEGSYQDEVKPVIQSNARTSSNSLAQATRREESRPPIKEEPTGDSADLNDSTSRTRNKSRTFRGRSRFSLGADEKERIRLLMANDRSALALVGGEEGSEKDKGIKDEVE